MKRDSKAAGKSAAVCLREERTRKTRGSNICWPALIDVYNREAAPCVRRTPKCEYLCGGSFMYISFSFFFLLLLLEEMIESIPKKETPSRTTIYTNFIIISKNYIYVIILSNGRTQLAIIISSSIPTIHAISLSLSVQLPFAHLPRPCNSSLALRALVRGNAICAHRFLKLMLGVLFL